MSTEGTHERRALEAYGLAWLVGVQAILEDLKAEEVFFADASFSGTVEHPSITFRLAVPRGAADIFRAFGMGVGSLIPEILERARQLNAQGIEQERARLVDLYARFSVELQGNDWRQRLFDRLEPHKAGALDQLMAATHEDPSDTEVDELKRDTIPPPPAEQTSVDNEKPVPSAYDEPSKLPRTRRKRN